MARYDFSFTFTFQGCLHTMCARTLKVAVFAVPLVGP